MENGASSTKEEGFLSRMALNDNKAGMEGLDRDKINKIIMETSKVDSNNSKTLVLSVLREVLGIHLTFIFIGISTYCLTCVTSKNLNKEMWIM